MTQDCEIDFVFRAYMQPTNNDWENRYESLVKLAEECGDHMHWSQGCGAIEPREWFIWAFMDYWRKEKFEMGAAKVMTMRNGDSLDLGVKNYTAIADRMLRKANMKR